MTGEGTGHSDVERTAMTSTGSNQPGDALETTGLRPESPGGAGMGEEGAPIGFTAEVGGALPETTDDPEQVRADVPDAATAGPRTPAERLGAGEDDDDVPRTG